MGSATLRWTSDRGFEVDVEAADDQLAVRLSAVPVPADGTIELEAGVDLDRLEILFKASVEIEGESAQLQDARLRLVREEDGTWLEIDARCEDVETGEIVPWTGRVPVEVPPGVPAKGGPKPQPTNEDDLDWDDETTLERLVVGGPETPLDPERKPRSAKGKPEAGGGRGGLQALLRALSSPNLDDEDDDLPSEATEEPEEGDDVDGAPDDLGLRPRTPASADGSRERGPTPARVTPEGSGKPAPSGGGRPQPREPEDEDRDVDDQSMGAHGEARSLLDLLVKADNLELEDDAALDDLAEGVAEILALPWSSERKAHRLSEWLLAQEGVADLFIADDDLAEILERW